MVINGGVFTLSGGLEASNVVVGSGARLTGSGVVLGNGRVAGGILAPRGGASAGLLDFSGSVGFSPSGTLESTVLSNTALDWIKAGGDVTGTCAVSMTNPYSATPVNAVLVNSPGAGTDYSSFALASGSATNWFLKVSGTDLLVTERWGDQDGDGLPDWWEVAYYGDRTNAAAAGQDDADTMSNFEEYIAGTDPTNTASLFCFTEISVIDTNKMVFKWLSAADRLYTVEVSTNLASGFTDLLADVPDTAPLNTYTNETGGTNGMHYRLRVKMNM